VLTNIGTLQLRLDGNAAEFQELDRDTNGNCLLVWNTTFDPPGQHYLDAKLRLNGQLRKGAAPDPTILTAVGQIAPFYSSNVCQFDPFYAEYDDNGAILYAQLPGSWYSADYSIELRDPSGELVKTIIGSVDAGVGEIEEYWDLTYEDGTTLYTDDSVTAVFNVTITDSFSSETFSGTSIFKPFKFHISNLEGNFTVAYAWDNGYQAQGSMHDAIQYGIVDLLLKPDWVGGENDNPYNSTFNDYTWWGNPRGNPGYLPSPTSVPPLTNNLADNDTRNFHFEGHGNPTSIGDSLSPTNPASVHIDCKELGKTLDNHSPSGHDPHFIHPYRFVFLDACETADTPGWAQAFGIPGRITDAKAAQMPGRVRAFVGWVNSPRGPDNDYEWNYEEQTFEVFYGAWMAGYTLDDCISMASMTYPPEPFDSYVLLFPLGMKFPWFQYYWPYNYKPFEIKIYGCAGITRTGYVGGHDQSPYYR